MTQTTEKTREKVLLPLKSASEGKNGGRPRRQLPMDLIRGLASQGFGCKTIAQVLEHQYGIAVSHMTIARRLKESCTHHWIIDSHNCGVCKICGAERVFPPPDPRVFTNPSHLRLRDPRWEDRYAQAKAVAGLEEQE